MNETRQVPLDEKGATIGRDMECDIVLQHSNISRHHARIHQDPFGRWIIEDLNSQNGILIDGKSIKTQAILPKQKISIRPFTLSISQEYDQPITAEPVINAKASVIDKGLEEQVISYDADRDSVLSAILIKKLNKLTASLIELQNPSQLYSQACSFLAKMFDALVAFVRIKPDAPPKILAHNFAKDQNDQVTSRARNINFSKSVLNALHAANGPVMARSGPSAGKNLILTVVDEATPHIVVRSAACRLDIIIAAGKPFPETSPTAKAICPSSNSQTS